MNAQMSKGVTKTGGVYRKMSFFVIAMIFRVLECLLEQQALFFSFFFCLDKNHSCQKILTQTLIFCSWSQRLWTLIDHSSGACTVQVSAWRAADEETSEYKVWKSAQVTTGCCTTLVVSSAGCIKSNFLNMLVRDCSQLALDSSLKPTLYVVRSFCLRLVYFD